MEQMATRDTEGRTNFAKIAKLISRRLKDEGCTLMSNNLQNLSYEYLEKVQQIARNLNATPLGIGSTFNKLDTVSTSDHPSDVDFTLMPSSDPEDTRKKLVRYLSSLQQMPKRDHDTDIEAGRQYKAYNLYNEGRIALVVSVDDKDKPVLGSLRLVDMNAKFPWTSKSSRGYKAHKVENNPTVKNPVADIGFPPHDENLKIWLDPRIFNPTIEKVGVLKDQDVTIEVCGHMQDEKLFLKLSQKSQAILAIRSIASGLGIPNQINLESFHEVAPESYSFIYNIIPSIEKIGVEELSKLLCDESFTEKIIKFTFPYMYRLIGMIKKGTDLQSVFNIVKKEYKINNLLQLMSLSAQEVHISADRRSGDRRDEAAKIGRIIETNVFDYDANQQAFDIIKNQTKKSKF